MPVSRFTSRIDSLNYGAAAIPAVGIQDRSLSMAALTRALARALPKRPSKIDVLKQLAMFCGAWLFVALLALTYGLDLSAGLF
jgi:hypothetical protein